MLAVRHWRLYIAQLISSTSESEGKAPSIFATLMHVIIVPKKTELNFVYFNTINLSTVQKQVTFYEK
jgi:hypothetical protein